MIEAIEKDVLQARRMIHLKTERVAGLDSLRGILALAVFLFHGAMPPIMLGYDATSPMLRKANALLSWSVNGQFAVVGFFLISGFCIHYPYIRRPLEPAGFYVARFLRLSVPALAAFVLVWACGFRPSSLLASIPAWSLWCELVYYLSYPLLLFFIRRGHLPLLLFLGYLGAALILFFSEAHDRYHEYGFLKTVAIGLPVWLFGAYLAENTRSQEPYQGTRARLLVVRVATFSIGAATQIACYLHVIGQGWSLTLASPLLFFWVREEIANYRLRPPSPAFEAIGAFSYSLYLLHLGCLAVLARAELGKFGGNVAWVITVAITLILAYLFYRLVEMPSHRLSQAAGLWVARIGGDRMLKV